MHETRYVHKVGDFACNAHKAQRKDRDCLTKASGGQDTPAALVPGQATDLLTSSSFTDYQETLTWRLRYCDHPVRAMRSNSAHCPPP